MKKLAIIEKIDPTTTDFCEISLATIPEEDPLLSSIKREKIMLLYYIA